MKSRTLQWVGVGLLGLIALIHFYLAPAEYEEVALLGYLFIANAVAGLAAAVGIRRRETWGWVLGVWVAGGAIVGYVITRTVGVPGMEPEEWLYPVGVLSMVLDMTFVRVFVLARPWVTGPASDRRDLLLVTGAALIFVTMFGLSGWLWASLSQDEDMLHVAHAEMISDAAFAERYGVQVLQIAPSMMNSVVDFRLRILDKTKAQTLLSDHHMMPVLIVDGGKAVLTPPNQHMHSRKLKNGTTYYAFYPNPDQIVRAGVPVAVQFGELRLPATVAQ